MNPTFLLLSALALSACATQDPPTKPFDFSHYEQACARAVASGYRSAEECRYVLHNVYSREYQRWLPPPPKKDYPLGGGRVPLPGGTMIIGDGHGSFLVIP